MLKWGKNMRYYKRSHVHYSKSAMKIIALVFMLVGVTFLAVGIGFAIHQTQLKNRCTLEVDAIISDILSKDERHENDDGHVSYSTVYTPVYSTALHHSQQYIFQQHQIQKRTNDPDIL